MNVAEQRLGDGLRVGRESVPVDRPGGRDDGDRDDDGEQDADAIAAARAWVWNTRRLGAALVWVSMIANRTRTLIAPMYTSTSAAATSGALAIT